MTERVLLMSGSRDWREYLSMELQRAGAAEIYDTEYSVPLRKSVVSFRPTAIVLHTENPGPSENPGGIVCFDQRRIESLKIMGVLREQFEKLPLLLVTSVPNENLWEFAEDCPLAAVLVDTDIAPARLAEDVLVNAASLRPPSEPPSEPPPPDPWGEIEIVVRQTDIACKVRAGQLVKNFRPRKWDPQLIQDLQKEFAEFDNDSVLSRDSEDENKKLEKLFLRASRTLHSQIFMRPLKEARAWCMQHMVMDNNLYHRITIPDGDYPSVPFELVATDNENEYLRAVSPVARKLVPKVAHRYQAPTPAAGGVRILFILAQVNGILSVPNRTFKSEPELSFEPLKYLDDELEETVRVCGWPSVKLLKLEQGHNAKDAISAALQAHAYDVVHFAGHSVRADGSNDVFLVLPGSKARGLDNLRAEDFAHDVARAGVRLVILSSCEGASCNSLSRLASYGIPAVAGFRWAIDDRDATLFTGALYRALSHKDHKHKAKSLVQAFEAALHHIKKAEGAKYLSWFSPVLVLQPDFGQPDAWHDFRVEVCAWTS